MIRNFLTFSFFIASLTLLAQVDYSGQYSHAKSLFNEGKYNLAMEAFKPLVAYDQNNPYSEYASFYYALSAYHQNYLAVAKDMLNQIKTLHGNWDKINEVNFWLAKIHFDNRDYFQGLKQLAGIQDKKFEKDIQAMKSAYISKVDDAEILRMMLEEYPKDELVARSLATVLSKNITDPAVKEELEELIDKHKLIRTDFIPEAPKTYYKDRYSVSLLLPFLMSTIDPTPSRKRTQIVIDFYEGIKLAVDTLAAQGVSISLRAYDTERSVQKTEKYLQTEELKNTDLIIGPLFQEENKIAQDFSMANKINIIHPVSNLSETIGINPHAFLFQPSAETLARKSASYLSEHLKDKDCMIFYGPGKKDSILAVTFQQYAVENGMTVLASIEVNSKEPQAINDILITATEYDEFKYPIEFTLKKDSLHSVFIASDDPLIYTKVVGAVETRNDSILVIGSENWLDDNAIEYDKYQSMGIVLTAPNFYDRDDPHYLEFERRYLLKHGRLPSNMARMGYELMLFLGHQLKNNGVYFQDGLSEAGVLPGYIGEGFDYRFSRDNQLVPFATFREGEYIVIEKR